MSSLCYHENHENWITKKTYIQKINFLNIEMIRRVTNVFWGQIRISSFPSFIIKNVNIHTITETLVLKNECLDTI